MTTFVRRLLFLFCCSVTIAGAHEHCLQPGMVWSCVGIVELSATNAGAPERRKMIRFTGGEMLAEVDKKGRLSRALFVKPSGLALYQGDGDLDAMNTLQSPFMFFNEAIVWGALLPLHTAYPSGPDIVPDGSAEKEVVIEKVRLTVHTTRTTSDQIEFRYEIAGAGGGMKGAWDRKQPKPWLNDMTIDDWKHNGPRSISSLGDARAVERTR